MKVKLFEQWLNEEVESELGGGGGTSWTNPVKVAVTKNSEKGHNVIQVKNSSGQLFNYEIIGSALGKSYDINFNWLKKTDKAGMILARTVSGGVEPYEVDFAKLSTLLPKLAKGQGDKIGNFAASVEFKKI